MEYLEKMKSILNILLEFLTNEGDDNKYYEEL